MLLLSTFVPDTISCLPVQAGCSTPPSLFEEKGGLPAVSFRSGMHVTPFLTLARSLP